MEEEFLHIAAGSFGAGISTVKTHLLDILDRHPDFYKAGDGTRRDPFILKYRGDVEEEPWGSAGSRQTDRRDPGADGNRMSKVKNETGLTRKQIRAIQRRGQKDAEYRAALGGSIPKSLMPVRLPKQTKSA